MLVVGQLSRYPNAIPCLGLEQLERALLGLVAGLYQILECLLSLRMLLTADDTTLVLHQVLLLQTAGCVVSSAMPDLCLAAYSRRLLGRAASGSALARTPRNITTRLYICSIHTVRVHFFC